MTMANRNNRIPVREVETGIVTVHAAGDPGGNYNTLCGLSTSDDLFEIVPGYHRNRIDCPDCWQVFQLAKSFYTSDFAEAAKFAT